ncbi:aldehyde dehydrogenase family protein [Alkalihalobacillus oceani]|uniref:aldehyde dehydrogenase family protein n=1 Tax=Halalkalibacter oceani TaxID=1653776 RepID=UPI00203B3FB2|nr:aldehyde dehydrogenase family protein [Halalkalibacter oceani]MCM3762253.1 aldehyde dehydrogenase family protein [Halalkalibacter oceani]
MKTETITRELMLINGKWTEAAGKEFFQVENPAKRGTIIAEVPRATAEDVNNAVQAANEAFDSWRKVPARERGRLLWKIADAVDAQFEELARTIATETGNALKTQAKGEAKGVADVIRYFGGVAGELKGETLPVDNQLFAYTQREPYGVIGGIIPWNAPVQLAALKIAPALAAGNTIVLKAAEDAPLGVLKLAKICADILPPGVVNILTGFGEECGSPLAKHPLVRKLTFTGSTQTGKIIMHEAAERIIPISLELGGKSPQIVYPDADSEKVIDNVMSAMRFARQGQSCSAGSRLYLHKSIYDSFVEKLIAKAKLLQVGDPLDENNDMGSIINEKQFNKVCAYIEEGINHPDLELLLGGLPPKEGPLSEGYFLEPTIFAAPHDDLRLAKEEIFGPVLIVIPWEDEEEVIKMANRSDYGLAAFIWTKDTTRAMRTANLLEAGWVQINRGGGMMTGHSYGGYKQSGIGREYSLESMIESFTQTKSIMIDFDE